MVLANRFERFRMRMMGLENEDKIIKEIPINDHESYSIALKAVQDVSNNRNEDPEVSKAMDGKELAYSEPLLGYMNTNPDYKERPYRGHGRELHEVLKAYSDNIILNAIINTRANQVATYCEPSRFSEKGIGFQVRLKNINASPTKKQKEEMEKIEEFILNTGTTKDVGRSNFTRFAKAVVRDTYRYDQVNFEKIFKKGSEKLERFVIKDPSTIFKATDSEGKLIKDGYKYVQVLDNKIVAKFTDREMAFAIRNPRSDIEIAGYGYPELEIALRHFMAHENTERFNDRFFSHGGTTRGILQIKTDANQSQHALDMFKREWKNSLRGVNGSWQIPVVSAEDVKFVNMTPSARDMEFEKWLNYLINVITSLYQIDPAEINFPNNGGATGSKGASLNEGNSAQKLQASQNKGLMPLLKFIADTINEFVVAEFGEDYIFQFVGGDLTAELEKITILSEKVKIGMTVDEVREELGLPGKVIGGDVPLSGALIQRIGQLQQFEQMEHSKTQERLQRLIEYTGGPPEDNKSDGVTFQDMQQGLAGNSDSVDGKGTFSRVGKDGQSKDAENTNSMAQGGQNRDKK